jgi:hypothetical protein
MLGGRATQIQPGIQHPGTPANRIDINPQLCIRTGASCPATMDSSDLVLAVAIFKGLSGVCPPPGHLLKKYMYYQGLKSANIYACNEATREMSFSWAAFI